MQCKSINLVALVLCLLSLDAHSQADLTIQLTPTKTIHLSDTSVTALTSNQGDVTSDPFRIKVWVSIDPVITDEDLNVMSESQLAGLEPFEVFLQNRHDLPLVFKFPLPLPDSRAFPRLTGDTLEPIEWIGQTIYARACIMNAQGTDELECTNPPGVGGALSVVPPRSMEGISGFLFNPEISAGDSPELIELTWPVPRADNGNVLIDRYTLTETSFDGASVTIDLDISELDVITDESGAQRYRTFLSGREPGRRYDYGSRQVCLGSVCSNMSSGGSGARPGNIYATIAATTNLNERVEINWQTFSNTTPEYYYVTRCIVGEPIENCAEVATFITNTSYVDLQVARGEQYIYTVEVCSSVRTSSAGISCNLNARSRIAVSTPGESGLVDPFEDDDNFQQATTVSNSVSQLRSFDTPTDEDWLEIVVASAQSITFRTSGETSEDTQLTLFDETGTNQIDFSSNTPGVPTSFATLITEELDPGIYFLKVNQGFIPGLPPQEVFNYTLDIEMSSQPIVIAPIINLLLGE